MNRTRFGLLGLCAVLFGVMAFGATAAHAEEGAQWLILDSNGTLLTAATLPASVGLETDTTGVLHTTILGIEVLFLCPVIAVENAVLKANGSIGEGARIKFSGCTTDFGGETAAECEPISGAEKGVIKTVPVHGLIILHTLAGGAKDHLLKVLPDNVSGKESKKFVTMELAKGCSIGTKVPVLGKLTLKDCKNEFLTHLVKHLVEAGPLTELWTIAESAGHEATILGSSWAFLTGAHVGLAFGGDTKK